MVCADDKVEEGLLLDGIDELPRPQSGIDGRQSGPRGPCNRHYKVAINVSVALVLVCVLVWPRRPLQRGDVDSHVALFSPMSIGSVMEDVIPGMSWKKAVLESLKNVRREVIESKPLDLTNLTNLTYEQRIPKEALHDGNLCADEEEEFEGLCYEKCAVLTDGFYPVRTTAWSCCMQQPCTFMNSKFTNPLHLCDGFDVSGIRRNRACPHAPGSCLVNEEFHLGRCYKKCAILTNNAFPFRSAVSSCCRYNSHLACLDAVNVQSSASFNVGGGLGDGHASTPADSHAPLLALTEA